ncbi:MAG: hypothetical protein HY751_06925 [Nitrospinae bacterium]|nr:hypothetical protein [Nitrospinota bacterium]
MASQTVMRVVMIAMAATMVVTHFGSRAQADDGHKHAGATAVAKKKYYCTMDPQVVSDKPGNCPVCGMYLVEMKEPGAQEDKKKVRPQ